MTGAQAPARRASTGIHQNKRLKIDVACNTCRLRKVKCDGVRPGQFAFAHPRSFSLEMDNHVYPGKEVVSNYAAACGNCTRKFDQRDKCQYSIQIGERSNEQEHQANVQLPLAGVDKPSGVVRQSQSRITAMQSPTETLHRPLSAAPFITSPTAGSSRSNTQRLESQEDVTVSVVDSMTAVVDDGATTGEYFGSSSAGSFITQVKDAINAQLGQPKDNSGQKVRSQGAISLTSPSVSPSYSLTDYVLPPRKLADHLVAIYWMYVDPLYPFLSRPKWELCYGGLFAGTPIDTDERVFVATLNIMFALSTELDESLSPVKRNESSSAYFRRAQNLLPVSFMESGSVALVQYLLLSSQYLQSTNHPHQTWMVVGSAVRIAQSLGLHLPDVSGEVTQLDERELLRRIWHGCILMDR